MVLAIKDPSANAREVRGKGLIPGISGRFSGGSRNFPGGSDCKASAYNVGDLGSIPWRRKWQPTPVFLPGKSHGQRSLVGRMGAKSRTQLSGFTFTFFSGGGHANQLWYSCLENLMYRGFWQATVHRVTKSWTRLK